MAKALFLDRDGVLNEEKDGSYIFHPDELNWIPGVLTGLGKIRRFFDYVLVVTNQRGVGRGFMTLDDLAQVHEKLCHDAAGAGCPIDRVYFAADADRTHPLRKPNTGMGLAAKADFPDIDFHASVMVGNNLSDMQFGRQLGMHTVFVHTTLPPVTMPHPLIDAQFPGLPEWIASQFPE